MNQKLAKCLLVATVVSSLSVLADQGPERSPGGEPRNADERRGPPRERIREHLRQQVTDEQRLALRDHKEALQAKNLELQDILKAANMEYLELSDKDDKTREDRVRLMQLRRELIAGSADAQAKLEEIKQLNESFGQSHPDLGERFERGVDAIRDVKDEIDVLLAAQSEVFAALLAKENKTEEEVAQLKELRKDLIKDNPEAQELRRKAHAIRERIRERREDRRDRREDRKDRREDRRDLREDQRQDHGPGDGAGTTDNGTPDSGQ